MYFVGCSIESSYSVPFSSHFVLVEARSVVAWPRVDMSKTKSKKEFERSINFFTYVGAALAPAKN